MRQPRLTRYSITLTRPAPRLKIALVADVHACWPWMSLKRIAGIVAQTNALGADLILLLGDYVGHARPGRPLAPEPVAQALARLTAPLGVYAVFGNHDWRDDPGAQAARTETKWHRAFAKAGITTLCNQVVRLGTTPALQLAGLESQEAYQTYFQRSAGGGDDLGAVLDQLDPGVPTLLMAHEPDIFPDLPQHIDLTVCGHTHGGQIAPFGRPIVVPSKYGARYAYGHMQEGARQLVVSGGLGCSGVPVRLGRRPEIVALDLA